MYKHYITYKTDGPKKVRGPSYKVQQYFNLIMQTYGHKLLMWSMDIQPKLGGVVKIPFLLAMKSRF